MNISQRIIHSLRDGSFVHKTANRISRVQYVPDEKTIINNYISENYPFLEQKNLSERAKRLFVDFYPIFKTSRVSTIVYAGAHVGDTAVALNDAFPGLTFYLIEPVPQIFANLKKNVKDYKNMYCINLAAGSENKLCEMLVDSYLPASSFLPYKKIALKEYPFLGKQKKIEVHIMPLDEIMQKYGNKTADMILMDVQGYEDEVLKGAKQTLKKCKIVMSELSLQKLYSGSSTFDSVYQILKNEGFKLQYLLNPMKGESRQILQIDGVFIK